MPGEEWVTGLEYIRPNGEAVPGREWLTTTPGTQLSMEVAIRRRCWSCRWGPRHWRKRYHFGHGPDMPPLAYIDPREN